MNDYMKQRSSYKASILEKIESAKLLYKEGMYSQAIALCNEVISCRHDFYAAYSERSYNFYRLKKYDEAFADVKKLIELEPELPNSYFQRANWSIKLGRYLDAIKDLDFVVNSKNEYFIDVARFRRAFCLFKIGEKKGAITDCMAVPKNFSFYLKTPDHEGKVISRSELIELVNRLNN